MTTAEKAIRQVLKHEGGYVNDPNTVLAELRLAIQKEQGSTEDPETKPGRIRPYGCSALGCSRRGYAKGFCNAHYIRSRNGRDMIAPILRRSRGQKCVKCGKATGSKGGWERCARCYKMRRRAVIKGVLMGLMGGRCGRCGFTGPHRVFDFHHVKEKTVSPSAAIDNLSLEEISAELSKCELICANCHRLEHSSEN